MPRLTYPLSVTNLVPKELNCLDGKIRSTVKRWLHLPSCTTDNFFYTRISQGGLGIPCLAKLVPAGKIATAVKLSQSSDMVTRTLDAQWKVLDERNEVAAKCGLLPITIGARKYRPNWRKSFLQNWQHLDLQGVWVSCYAKDSCSQAWKRNLGKMKEQEYLKALQLQANVYPCMEVLARGRPDRSAACRRCKNKSESLAHIVGQCPKVKKMRIARHNKLANFFASEVPKSKFHIIQEPSFNSQGRVLRPDMIVYNDDKAVVLDFSIRFETRGDALSAAYSEKVRKYEVLSDEVRHALLTIISR